MAPTPDEAAGSPWLALTGELDQWAAADRLAAFWWRDDDAAALTPALERLVATAVRARAPLALAVIPKDMAADLPITLAPAPHVSVVQHGFAHINYAQKGQGAWELGLHRPLATVFADLAAGFRTLRSAFADRFVPLVVPPWNRIDPAITEILPDVGLHGLSTFGPRPARSPAPGVVQINTHCDPIKWKGGARFTGTARAIDDLVAHLRDRREGHADADEPTGLLTHHLDLDEECWVFVETLLTQIGAHPAACWRSVGELLDGAA